MNATPEQIDALTELFNIGVGRGATVLNAMLNSHVVLRVPFIRTMESDSLLEEIRKLDRDLLATVNMRFKGAFSGSAELVVPDEDASKLVTVLTGEEPLADDMDALRAGTLCEIGNIVLNSVVGAISNVLGLDFHYSVPTFAEGNYEALWTLGDVPANSTILFARTWFMVENLKVNGNIVLFLQVGALDQLLAAIDGYVKTQLEGEQVS